MRWAVILRRAAVCSLKVEVWRAVRSQIGLHLKQNWKPTLISAQWAVLQSWRVTSAFCQTGGLMRKKWKKIKNTQPFSSLFALLTANRRQSRAWPEDGNGRTITRSSWPDVQSAHTLLQWLQSTGQRSNCVCENGVKIKANKNTRGRWMPTWMNTRFSRIDFTWKF